MACPVVMSVQSSQHGGLWLGLDLFPEAWHSACLVCTSQALSIQMEASPFHHLTMVCWGHAATIANTRCPFPVSKAAALDGRKGNDAQRGPGTCPSTVGSSRALPQLSGLCASDLSEVILFFLCLSVVRILFSMFPCL